MKVGDIVKVADCVIDSPLDFAFTGPGCGCFFCNSGSNRVGVVLTIAPHNAWCVMFDCGEWELHDFDEARGDVEVISEAR
jgi:hypothetical protein